MSPYLKEGIDECAKQSTAALRSMQKQIEGLLNERQDLIESSKFSELTLKNERSNLEKSKSEHERTKQSLTQISEKYEKLT